MSFCGNFLCFTTCHYCRGETGGGITNLGGIFLLEGSLMPFFLEEACHSFGKTSFPFENFFFLISCFESSNEW